MLKELEMDLVDLLREPLKGKARVGTLPDTSQKDLVRRWGADAPAVYVTPQPGTISGDIHSARFTLILVAKNARGHKAARHGDKNTIGLYPLADQVMTLIHHARPVVANWQVNRYTFLTEPVLRDAGLFVAMIEVGAETDMPSAEDFDALPPFTDFHADIDLVPHSSHAQHQEWADENYGGPELPDLQGHTGLSGPKE
ncbi:MAG TPA: hypothetical protein VNV36_06235 [Pseudomonas sp.]|uniref:hypothetical protein n=1 Tax=Pseudomonas sp. TaxID=306 RepID=UPI002CE96A07|nr:hypothetical protein [Pseudomonas sp.]HWH86354.1 hypothetical protein [Pseudomonas sp.]